MNMEDKDKIKEVLKALSDKLKKPENLELLEEFLMNCGIFDGTTDSAYVRLQRKVLRQKSRAYYQKIKDEQLKKELTYAHSQMLWYRTINELEKYFLFVNYQIENMLNFYITENDAFTKIQSNARAYHKLLNPVSNSNKSRPMDVDCYIYFFNRNSQPPKPNRISKINSLWAKLLFWAIDKTGDIGYLERNYWNFNDIIEIRNEQNHANYERKGSKCERWYQLEDNTSFGFIDNILKTIRDSIL